MRRAFLQAVVALSFLGATALTLRCGSDDSTGSNAGSDGAIEPYDICSSFTEAGARCRGASATLCFPECEGGCYCAAAAGGAVWMCITDTTCFPDTGLFDTGNNPGGDGGNDAGDAGTG